MGLDAVVFRNVRNLEKIYGPDLFDVDNVTGEAILRANTAIKIPREAYVATRRRLGNLLETTSLKEAAEKALGDPNSLIVSRVLQTGSHSGDSLPVEDYPKLSAEITRLRAQGGEDLEIFVEAMESLLLAGEAESNPIVFV
jgi:hypothetical protein